MPFLFLLPGKDKILPKQAVEPIKPTQRGLIESHVLLSPATQVAFQVFQ